MGSGFAFNANESLKKNRRRVQTQFKKVFERDFYLKKGEKLPKKDHPPHFFKNRAKEIAEFEKYKKWQRAKAFIFVVILSVLGFGLFLLL